MFKHITTIAALSILTFSFAFTAADEFGGGANSFDIEFVTIGNPGNPADTTGNPNPAGSVGYTYRMGQFEISRDMVTKANNAGNLGITLLTLTPFGGNGPNRPAGGVSWNEAARFVNWLNTSTGNPAAYKFEFQPGEAGYDSIANIQLWDPGDAGYDPNNLFRNSQARYFLPSYDEWYKAAYYDPSSGIYSDYPTGSDTAPTAVTSGTAADTAVYAQTAAQGPADISVAGGLSPYGTMAQGGNMREWQETESDLVNDLGSAPRGRRGGAWNIIAIEMLSSSGIGAVPNNKTTNATFRVARSLILGDANNDGVLNNIDIAAFGLALFDPSAYAAAFPGVDPDVVLDMNNDGAFNNADIAGFATALGF